jgi:hypothetical protein
VHARSRRDEMGRVRFLLAALLLSACGDSRALDGGVRDAGVDSGVRDAGSDGGRRDSGALDAGGSALGAHRDRLLATLGEPCATWASFDASQRAVFLTLTHRMFLSRTPDGLPMLAHVTRVYLVLGGGDGEDCGGDENNRLFLQMDAYLHARMVETWDGARIIEDGGGSTWLRTRDAAGPHDPFDASDETDVGLSCTLLFEDSDSRPPTAQAHFFLAGSEAAVERGSGISLAADPYMLEIDHDFDCIHRSNPTCSDFEERYRTNYGDFECEWVPSSCTPIGGGCYRSAS